MKSVPSEYEGKIDTLLLPATFTTYSRSLILHVVLESTFNIDHDTCDLLVFSSEVGTLRSPHEDSAEST